MLRIGTALALVICLAVASRPAAQPPAAPAEPLRTPPDRTVDLKHVKLDLKVDLPAKRVDAVATLEFRPTQRVRSISLNAVDFEVKKVSLVNGQSTTDGEPLKFTHDGKTLALDLEQGWQAGASATVRVEYTVKDPKAGLYFFGPTAAEPEVPYMVWSQGESTTNRYWFPCFDHPDQKQTTEIVATVAKGYDALSNGKLAGRTENADGGVTFHWKQDQPHVSYLVTLVVGKFDVVREDWNGKEVSYYVPAGKRDAIGRTFGRTREMIDFFSEKFGTPYPWDKYAQVVVEQFSAGGMENTSATTLTDFCLHDSRAMLDSSPDGLIAHELGHQWWGDLLTCRDWAHLWLNEGFASYCEVLWDEHALGVDEMHLDLLRKAQAAAAGGKTRPIVDRYYPSPDSMFDARAYPKGAWVLHMLRSQLGEDAFWKGIREYAQAHKFQSVETHDLRRSLEKASGRNLEAFFRQWTERPGHPALKVSSKYDAEQKQLLLTVTQTQPGDPFAFPLPVSVHCEGQSLPVKFDGAVREKEHQFAVPVPSRPKMLLIDPDLTLLAEVTEEKGRDLWRTQLRFAPSIAPRIAAAKELGKSQQAGDRDALAAALATDPFHGVQQAAAQALGATGGDAGRDALLNGLKLPHPKTRRAAADELGKFALDASVAEALKAKIGQGDPSYFVEAAVIGAYGKLRRPDGVAVLTPALAKPSHNEVIRQAALTGLGASGDPAALPVLLAWSERGKPRTCRTAALGALAQLSSGGNLSDDDKKKVATRVAECVTEEGRAVRRAALGAMRDLGQVAQPSLAALDAIAAHDPDGRIQDLAKKTAEAVRGNLPAPAELKALREELDRLKKANATLADRLDKLGPRERKQ